MLRGKIFSKATAYAGILGNVLLIVVEIILTLKQMLPDWGMAIAIGAGLSMMTWYFLVGRRLLQLRVGQTEWSARESSQRTIAWIERSSEA